jgi:hypothetical protein
MFDLAVSLHQAKLVGRQDGTASSDAPLRLIAEVRNSSP